jgi:C-terminal processing protease CtpA/Prc
VSVSGQKYDVDEFEHVENLPEFWQRPHSDATPLFQQKYIEKDSILVIQYNSCWGRELEEKFGDKTEAKKLPYFESFADEVFETLEKKPVAKLLFDMRFNGGGSSLQGTRLIEKLSSNKDINRQGTLFVATSEHTFSSAVINTMNFRQKTEAIIIGTPSGGTPNHYGEVRTLVLPKTGLEVYHSTNYFKYVDGDAKAVYPDIEIETNYSDIFKGKDPIYEFVKNYGN